MVGSYSASGLDLWAWWVLAHQTVSSLVSSQEFENSLTNELDWFLQSVSGLDRLALRLESFKEKEQIQLPLSLSDLADLWQRRLNERVPIQYLLGSTTWRNFSLIVSPAVLIPRPETETLIDLAVTTHQRSNLNVKLEQGPWADLGTGSGAIALGLALALPDITIHAVDCSADALAIAQQNTERLDLTSQIQFHQGSWFEPLGHLEKQLSGVIANPPYIPTALIESLQPEVAWHEPHLALDGGVDGLDCIRHLIKTAPVYLQPGGSLLLEIMAGQSEIVLELIKAQGSYSQVQIHSDLAGIERFALAYLSPSA